jgi:hypothetical protein
MRVITHGFLLSNSSCISETFFLLALDDNTNTLQVLILAMLGTNVLMKSYKPCRLCDSNIPVGVHQKNAEHRHSLSSPSSCLECAKEVEHRQLLRK